MALTRFFSNIGSIDLAKQMMSREAIVRCQKYEYIGTGALVIITGASTLTPAVSPAWTIDNYKSAVAKNLLVKDNNGKVATCKIASNTATALTFDEATLLLVEDGTTAAALTTTNTYEFYVLTPSDDTSGAYGPYLGDTEGLELAINDEVMVHKYSSPAKKRRQDLKERSITVQGGVVNVVNDDVFEMLFASSNYGLQTGYKSQGVGSNNDFNRFYRFTFESQDVTGRDEKIIVHQVQVSLNGNFFSKSASGHMMLPLKGEVLADGFYPETANLLMRVSTN